MIVWFLFLGLIYFFEGKGKKVGRTMMPARSTLLFIYKKKERKGKRKKKIHPLAT